MRVDRRRLLLLAGLFGLAAFYAGTQLVGRFPTPLRNPLTGRPVAGLATNAGWMDRAEREAEEEPERALDLLAIGPGLVVADVGAGSGYMTLRLARRVGPAGKVYASDLQPGLLRLVADKARAAALSNVVIVEGREDDARLPEHAIDLALLVDVYHEFRDAPAMLRSIRRALVPGGRLAVVEYRLEDPRLPIAPTHRMSVADLRAEIEAAGFALQRLIEELPRQHLIVFVASR